ncbi:MULTISPECIES: hypothetical protein [unclassified Rhizobium]|uniref:hypothetical protein n=1 Tax=unclassified Rhizobium TaxID=2613769 RepID=UPI0006FE7FBD|nr:MULTISPECIES: hypothetical protein [unclassified Rhizobium]KQV37644.1 hypothetical protein ASC86_23770 [Rhizobium sp. Root1212]KRD34546.1 hypothetical protein ASE37_22340 [Rhizobium sp. Root268]
MKLGVFVVSAALLASCTTAQIEPIPGSITYGGQPRTKLTKSPIGSKFVHTFHDQQGNYWSETYQLLPDRSLKIISRRRTDDFTLNEHGGL